MKIEIGNQLCRVTDFAAGEASWLGAYLAFDGGTSDWDGGKLDLRLYDFLRGTFPTGLLSLVRKAAVAAGHAFEVVDRREVPCLPNAADLSFLGGRQYQHDAVEAAVCETRGCLWCPTGSGKTRIAAGIAARLCGTGWVFLVHKRDLLHQAATEIGNALGVTVGVVGDGQRAPRLGPGSVTVATYQTLHQTSMTELAPIIASTGGIFCDEFHTVSSDTFFAVVEKFRCAYYRVGLSGTPLARGDSKSILGVAAIGPVIYRIKPDVLIEAGILARPRIRMTELHQQAGEFCWTWQQAHDELIAGSVERNSLLVDLARQAAKPALLFVRTVEHGHRLRDMLTAAGIKAGFVWGDHPTAQRRAAVEKLLVTGELDVLVASVIFNEGVDLPSLRSAIIGAGGKSIIAAIQRIGRAMRSDDGRKSECEVWDVMDLGHATLEKHARARAAAYRREGHEVEVVAGDGVTRPITKRMRKQTKSKLQGEF